MNNPKGKKVMVGGMEEKEIPAKETDRYYVFVDKGNCVYPNSAPKRFITMDGILFPERYSMAIGTLQWIKDTYMGQKPYRREEHKERMRTSVKSG